MSIPLRGNTAGEELELEKHTHVAHGDAYTQK